MPSKRRRLLDAVWPLAKRMLLGSTLPLSVALHITDTSGDISDLHVTVDGLTVAGERWSPRPRDGRLHLWLPQEGKYTLHVHRAGSVLSTLRTQCKARILVGPYRRRARAANNGQPNMNFASFALSLILSTPLPAVRLKGMACIPAGPFIRGNDDGEKGSRCYWFDAYWMDIAEVTISAYRACVEAARAESSLKGTRQKPAYRRSVGTTHINTAPGRASDYQPKRSGESSAWARW